MKQLFKIAFSLGLLLASGTAAARCMDLRALLIAPCPEGRILVPVRGICTESYEAESLYCAAKEAPECIDQRAAFYQPCPEGQVRIFVQGRCEHNYESEHSYCAVRLD